MNVSESIGQIFENEPLSILSSICAGNHAFVGLIIPSIRGFFHYAISQVLFLYNILLSIKIQENSWTEHAHAHTEYNQNSSTFPWKIMQILSQCLFRDSKYWENALLDMYFHMTASNLTLETNHNCVWNGKKVWLFFNSIKQILTRFQLNSL